MNPEELDQFLAKLPQLTPGALYLAYVLSRGKPEPKEQPPEYDDSDASCEPSAPTARNS